MAALDHANTHSSKQGTQFEEAEQNGTHKDNDPSIDSTDRAITRSLMHKVETAKYECPSCHKTFRQKEFQRRYMIPCLTKLKLRHERVTSAKSLVFACEDCSYRTTHRNRLTYHKIKRHGLRLRVTQHRCSFPNITVDCISRERRH